MIKSISAKHRCAAWMSLSVFSLSLGINLFNIYLIDAIAVAAALWGFWEVRNGQPWPQIFGLKINLATLLIISFFTCASIGYLISSPMTEQQWVELANFRWIGVYFAYYFLGTRLSYSSIPKSLFAVPFGLVLSVILFRHFSNYDNVLSISHRIQGFYGNPNNFALAISIVWAFIFGFSIATAQRKKTLSALLFLILLLTSIAIIATYSRGSWAAIITSVLVGLIYTKNRKYFFLSLIFGSILIIMVNNNLFGLLDRLAYTMDMNPKGAQYTRIAAWKATFQIFLDHPLFGVGSEEYIRLYPTYYSKLGLGSDIILNHAHNQFLEILAGAGITGFISYIGVFTTAVVYFHKKFKATAFKNYGKSFALAAILAIVALMVSSFTDSTFRLHEARNYVLMLLGFSVGYLSDSSTKSTPPPHSF